MLLSILRKMNPNRLIRPHDPKILPIYQQFFQNLSNQFSEQPETETKSKNVPTASIEENPYFAKYAEKIRKAKLEKGEGKDGINIDKPLKLETAKEQQQQQPQSVQAKPMAGVSKDTKRSLDNIVKVDLLKDKSTQEIIDIWSEYHRHKDCIFGTLPPWKYDVMFDNTRQYPNFILPLPRASGSYEFFVLEFQEHSCYFTPLAAYHLHKDMAPVCLSIYHYPELRSQNIVLMRGDFDANILNIMECQCLANQLQYYYINDDPTTKLTLHLFNKDSKSFDHNRLIEHLENNVLATSRPSSLDLNKQD